MYTTLVKPLVASCLDGYNTAAMVYGQTGTGKTHTMGSGGVDDAGHNRGIILRALEDLFDTAASRSDKYKFVFKVSYLEIYLEEMGDLLALRGHPTEAPEASPQLREDGAGNTVLTGVEEREVSSFEEAVKLFTSGGHSRQVASTLMNDRSSRSHTIFTMVVEKMELANQSESAQASDGDGDGDGAPAFTSSRFHFVDLAGSERAKATGNIGVRFKESVHINTGLLALGNVVSALADKRRRNAHVPYRESKLTRLLKDALGGNSRTIMIVCVGPSGNALSETLASLKYATRVRYIKNKPRVNTTPQDLHVARMQTEINALREQLQSRAPGNGQHLQREISELTGEIDNVLPDLRSLLKPAALARLEELLARNRQHANKHMHRPLTGTVSATAL